MAETKEKEASRGVCFMESTVSRRSRVRARQRIWSCLSGGISVTSQLPWIREDTGGKGEREGFYPLLSDPRVSVTSFRAGEKNKKDVCEFRNIYSYIGG